LVTLLAAIGAILIVVGGLLGFLLSFGSDEFGRQFGLDSGAFAYGVLAVVLGLLILVFSGYTHYRGAPRSVVGGIVLIVLGAIAWEVVGGWVLVALGSLLTVIAGIVLAVEALVSEARSPPGGP
jgi:Ca2+/H+ antiporter